MASQPQPDISFFMGQFTQAMEAFTNQMKEVNERIGKIDERLRLNEQTTNTLTVKMAMLGTAAGAVGSFGMSVIQHFLFK